MERDALPALPEKEQRTSIPEHPCSPIIDYVIVPLYNTLFYSTFEGKREDFAACDKKHGVVVILPVLDFDTEPPR